MSRPIVITGASGQLGQALMELFASDGEVRGFAREDLDVADGRAVAAALAPLAPRAILNCAAFNAVDRAEDDPQAAFAVNAIAVANLARAAAAAGATLVHYGTDFVFDGEADRPYVETDTPRPRGVYAASKLVGEWFAADAPRHYVLRVESLFGGVYRLKSSVDRIIEQLEAGEPAPVFADRVVSPSYVFDVAAATAHVLRTAPEPGVYHCVNTGSCTWLELGQAIARELGVEPSSLRPIRLADLNLRAPRPRFCALSNDKLRRAGCDMPTWQAALHRHLARHRAGTQTRDTQRT